MLATERGSANLKVPSTDSRCAVSDTSVLIIEPISVNQRQGPTPFGDLRRFALYPCGVQVGGCFDTLSTGWTLPGQYKLEARKMPVNRGESLTP